ncbi:MAG: replication terminator protein [Anaerovoracaceae bacterium]
MSQEKRINLESFMEGGFSERINEGIEEVSQNIADLNTDWKKKREITIKVVFETNEARELTNVTVECKPKLVPKKPIKTSIVIDKTMQGQVLVSEFKKQIPGQGYMKVDDETGEVFIGGTGMSELGNELAGLQIVK